MTRQQSAGCLIFTNPDTDGILSALLAADVRGWQLGGWYDLTRIYVGSGTTHPLPLSRVRWLDLDMMWPGMVSVGNHVLGRRPRSAAEARVTAQVKHDNPCNGNVWVSNAGSGNYAKKYPFENFAWLYHRYTSRPDTAMGKWRQRWDPLAEALCWLTDGGFESVNLASRRGDGYAYRDNVVNWATRMGDPLARTLREQAKTDPSWQAARRLPYGAESCWLTPGQATRKLPERPTRTK